MRTISWLIGAAVAAAASAVGAQPMPQSNDQHQAIPQHQATGQHEVASGGEKCCCEEMMHKMMMKMQQGMAMPKVTPQPDQDHTH